MKTSIILCLLFIITTASTPLVVDGLSDVVSLNGTYSVFIDEYSYWRGKDILRDDFNARFRKVEDKTPTYTVSSNASIWAKSKILYIGNDNVDYVINTEAPYIDTFRIYAFINGDFYDSIVTTETKKLKYSVLFPSMPITLERGDELSIVVKYRDEAPVPLILSLKKTGEFYRYSSFVLLFNGLFYGILLTLLLYNLVP